MHSATLSGAVVSAARLLLTQRARERGDEGKALARHRVFGSRMSVGKNKEIPRSCFSLVIYKGYTNVVAV